MATAVTHHGTSLVLSTAIPRLISPLSTTTTITLHHHHNYNQYHHHYHQLYPWPSPASITLKTTTTITMTPLLPQTLTPGLLLRLHHHPQTNQYHHYYHHHYQYHYHQLSPLAFSSASMSSLALSCAVLAVTSATSADTFTRIASSTASAMAICDMAIITFVSNTIVIVIKIS